MENEPNRTWNKEMHKLIQDMNHAVNLSEAGVLTQEDKSATAKREIEYVGGIGVSGVDLVPYFFFYP